MQCGVSGIKGKPGLRTRNRIGKKTMKLLMVGAHSGWMGLHLAHFCGAFRQRGIEVIAADYHQMERVLGLLKAPGDDERRNRNLERLVHRHRPDMILFVSSWKFDFARLRSYFSGTVAVYDYDGPRRKTVEEYCSLCDQPIDRFFTVSQWLQTALKEQDRTAVYLPHGVNTDYYAPGGIRRRLASPLSYIGRMTERRIQLCAKVRKYGLALYGERWKKSSACHDAGLADCARMDRDVRDRELIDIYSSSNAVLNILQEPLNVYQTILSIQCFAVPAAGSCLIAEYVEELPRAFEPGREVLAFRNAEELEEWAGKCAGDPSFAKAVGEAGRRRCLQEHRWTTRVDAFLREF